MPRDVARVPHTAEITLVTAGVEQQFDLQLNFKEGSIKRVQLKSRTADALQYSYAAGGPYVTIPKGHTYWQDEIDGWVISLFLVGTINGQVAELEWWT